MLISVITINYNDVDGLKNTMDSVINQTYKDIEYIVIDGGSTDGSKELIKKHAAQLSYWVSEPDKGIYNAMNKGIKVATGEYLLFLNSGDWLVDNHTIKKLSNNLNNADILYGNLIKVFPDDQKIIDKGPNGKEITLHNFFKGTLNHPASFIKKELFYKFGYYDETLKIVSDWKFFLISIGLNNSKIKYVNQNISSFNMSGLSNLNILARNKERKQVLQELIPHRILKDYEELSLKNKIINKKSVSMLLNIENSNILKKINMLWLKLLSKFI